MAFSRRDAGFGTVLAVVACDENEGTAKSRLLWQLVRGVMGKQITHSRALRCARRLARPAAFGRDTVLGDTRRSVVRPNFSSPERVMCRRDSSEPRSEGLVLEASAKVS